MTQPDEDDIPKQGSPHADEPEPGDDAGEWEEEIEAGEPTQSDCRCGECCRHLIIEVALDDAKREPKIKEQGSPIYLPAELTASGEPELEGYLLNSAGNGNACAFLDQTSNLCSIYETRPWACRVFDCDGEGREQLIELGIKPGNGGWTR
jgi:Fe-S-cluster containining protein